MIKSVKSIKKDIRKKAEKKMRDNLIKRIKNIEESKHIFVYNDDMNFEGSNNLLLKLKKKGYLIEPAERSYKDITGIETEYGVIISYLGYDELPDHIKKQIEAGRDAINKAK